MGKTKTPNIKYYDKPIFSNKCQEIYHNSKNLYKHQGEEWNNIFRQTFIELCIKDGLVKSYIEIVKPSLNISRY